jgi:hypothetical protein
MNDITFLWDNCDVFSWIEIWNIWSFSGRFRHTVSEKELSGFQETILNIIPMKV